MVGEDEGVGVLAVDGGVGGRGAAGESGVEGGDFGVGVGYVVEEGAGKGLERELRRGEGGGLLVRSVVEVVHHYVEGDGLVCFP